MSTTKKYLQQEEFYKVKTGKKPSKRCQTNPRYKSFQQVLYTAGDEEQFSQHITKTNAKTKSSPDMKNNAWKDHATKYQLSGEIGTTAVMDTFRYLFHNVKKAIFVRIVNNKLEVFLPFSKHNFDNKWGSRLKMSQKEVLNVYKTAQENAGRSFHPSRINRNVRQWAGNNFLIRNEFPPIEGDSNVCVLKHMFQTLCKKRELPNMEFFLNRRDSPLVRKDGKHPYSPLAGDSELKYVPQELCPVLSMCSHSEYADLPIPNWDDWHRIGKQDYHLNFSSSYINREEREYPVFPESDWRTKKDMAIFRGTSTGHGVTAETNSRLKIVQLAKTDPRLDVGITKWNLRPRAFQEGDGFVIKTIEDLSTELVPYVSPLEQSKFKYIINLDGHVCAFRLSMELAMGSVILLQESKYKLWFTPFLKEGEHFLSIKSDLSDLSEKLDWCQNHQDECAQIAINARNFYQVYLTQDGILDFFQKMFWDLRTQIFDYKYNVMEPLRIISRKESRHISRLPWKLEIPESDWKILKQSRTTTLELNATLGIVRKSVVASKIKEFNHEIFIGAKVIPQIKTGQFAVFRGHKDKKSYWDYIPGPTFAEFLDQDAMDIQQLNDIVLQVCGILQQSLETAAFCHNDLFPWNIILTPDTNERKYFTKHGMWRSVSKTKVVIVDFGKSHAVYKNLHFGRIKPFETSTIQDIVIFIVSTCHLLMTRHRDKTILNWVFRMLGFLQQEREYCPVFHTVREVRNFTNRAKKYTEIMYSEKGCLNFKEPADLVKWLRLKIEDKKLSSPIPREILLLKENVFDDPREILRICKRLGSYCQDENTKTFRTIAGLLTELNKKKHPEIKIYQEILDCIA